MMVRLNPDIKTVWSYTPPIPVTRHFDDPSPTMTLNEQIEYMLWIPAALVGRWLGQHQFLIGEADELFSIGVLRLTEIVHDRERYESSPVGIGTIVYGRCHYAMESYINNLNSVVKVSTSTRYKNKRDGKETPMSLDLEGLASADERHAWHPAYTVDDHSDLLLRDACEVLGYDYTNLTLKQKRRVADILLD